MFFFSAQKNQHFGRLSHNSIKTFHNSIHQPTSSDIMTKTNQHTVCTLKVTYNAHCQNNLEFTFIYGHWLAKHCRISKFHDQGISRASKSTAVQIYCKL